MIDVIIDTDIGDDIDDALAIAFALGCPELNVLGLTTVLGHTAAKARIAARLLGAAGAKHIPVYAGCGLPIRQEADPDKLPCQYMAGEMDALAIGDGHAVDFIISRVLAAARPVTLLAIGPLTNIAFALRKEPRLTANLERIVIMGGAYYFHYVEWNVWCDPEAADIVFRAGIPVHAVGLDVTKKCLMTEEHFSRLEAGKDSEVMALLLRMIGKWRADTGRKFPILHDALAVYALIGGPLLRFEREAIEVELQGKATRGFTFNRTDREREEQLVRGAVAAAESSRIFVAKEVDVGAFIDFFLHRLLEREGKSMR